MTIMTLKPINFSFFHINASRNIGGITIWNLDRLQQPTKLTFFFFFFFQWKTNWGYVSLLDAFSFGWSSGLIPINLKSRRAFKWSLFFASKSSNVPITLSHTFFSICITSRLWRNKLSFQYGNSKNMLLFLQLYGNAEF